MKRFIAYVIDIMIVFLIFMILVKLLPNNNVNNLNHELQVVQENFLNEEISSKEYISNFLQINYQIDNETSIYSGIYLMLICLFFIVIPTITKGKTIGLYIFKLKIDKPSVNILLKRNIIVNGILYLLLTTILVKILDYKLYFIIATILGFIQILLVIISAIMVIYRKDKKGLQDILSKSEIIKEV